MSCSFFIVLFPEDCYVSVSVCVCAHFCSFSFCSVVFRSFFYAQFSAIFVQFQFFEFIFVQFQFVQLSVSFSVILLCLVFSFLYLHFFSFSLVQVIGFKLAKKMVALEMLLCKCPCCQIDPPNLFFERFFSSIIVSSKVTEPTVVQVFKQ